MESERLYLTFALNIFIPISISKNISMIEQDLFVMIMKFKLNTGHIINVGRVLTVAIDWADSKALLRIFKYNRNSVKVFTHAIGTDSRYTTRITYVYQGQVYSVYDYYDVRDFDRPMPLNWELRHKIEVR